jgi:tRNA(Ile)-lysidine synthase
MVLPVVRGTGTKGLRGLRPSAKWKSGKQILTVLRPLLEVSHLETGKYCDSFNLKPRSDASNASLEPLRNRVRLELIPLLKSYNPQVVESLQRTAQLAGDDITCLEKEAERQFAKIAAQLGHAVTLDKKSLRKLDRSLQRYILRLTLGTVAGTLKDIEARHIEEMVLALDRPSGKKIDLPYGLVFTIDYERCLLSKDTDTEPSFPEITGGHTLKIPGLTTIPGWQIHAVLVKNRNKDDADTLTADFDYAKTGSNLIMRTRKNGDRFQPLGMPGMKKVGQFMLDAKIPQNLRNNIPIIAAPDGIAWVAGYRVDERFKVTDVTEKVLRLKLERI